MRVVWVGGLPGVGKTTHVARAAVSREVRVVSTDDVRAAAREHSADPALHVVSHDAGARLGVGTIVGFLTHAAAVLAWTAPILEQMEPSATVIVEGVHVIPSLVRDMIPQLDGDWILMRSTCLTCAWSSKAATTGRANVWQERSPLLTEIGAYLEQAFGAVGAQEIWTDPHSWRSAPCS